MKDIATDDRAGPRDEDSLSPALVVGCLAMSVMWLYMTKTGSSPHRFHATLGGVLAYWVCVSILWLHRPDIAGNIMLIGILVFGIMIITAYSTTPTSVQDWMLSPEQVEEAAEQFGPKP